MVGDFVIAHPIAAYYIGSVNAGSDNISTIASNFQINVCKSAGVSYGEAGDYGNAYRHTLWQSMITKEFDSEIATIVGYSHEDGSSFDLSKRSFGKIDNADAIADLLNNIIGRKIGNENKNASNKKLAQLVAKEFYENGLWTVREVNGLYELEKTKLTQAQYDTMLKTIDQKGNNGLNQ